MNWERIGPPPPPTMLTDEEIDAEQERLRAAGLCPRCGNGINPATGKCWTAG